MRLVFQSPVAAVGKNWSYNRTATGFFKTCKVRIRGGRDGATVYAGGRKLQVTCHVEFLLEHSLSVSVRLCLFLSVPRPSTLFFPAILCFSVPFCCIHIFPRPYYTSLPSVSSFQPSTLGSDPTSVSFDLASYCFHYCSAITPISPTPSHSDLLLSSASYCTMFRSNLIVPLCIITTSCSSLAPACKPTCVNPNVPVFLHSFPILISLEILLSPLPCFQPPSK